MAPANGQKWEVPYCTLGLIVGACLCNVMVFIGNLETARVMDELGDSTQGWSQVGLGLADSISIEVDDDLADFGGNISRVIEELLSVQDLMDEVLSVAGTTTETGTSAVALMQQLPPLSPKEQMRANERAGVIAITGAVDRTLRRLIAQVEERMVQLLEVLRPLLLKAGEWVHRFSGQQAEGPLETFSLTLDFVQQLFDEILSQNTEGRVGEDLMIGDTFTLFDVSGTGFVSVEDMRNVSSLYSISALQGLKSAQIVESLDSDGDGRLSQAEFGAITHDDKMYGILAVVLRTYAKKLSEIAGRVSSARMRDEIASSVVSYFELICAKNMTKVEWVADALTNGSVPLEFTADVMAQMCLADDDPAKLTTQSVGSTVVKKMMELNASNTINATNLLFNISFWESEGFEPADQPSCIEKITLWTSQAENQRNSLLNLGSAVVQLNTAWDGEGPMPELSLAEAGDGLKLASAAKSSCEAHMQMHLREKAKSKSLSKSKLFSSRGSQMLLSHLLGGKSATEGPSLAERAVRNSVPAQEATLQFAQWLSNNATDTAQRFRKQCFEYTGALVGQLDGFAGQLQGMSSMAISFNKALAKWSGPEGIERLEAKVFAFASNAAEEILHIVDVQVEKQLNETPAIVMDAINVSAHAAGGGLAHMIAEVVSGPLAEPLAQALAGIVAPNATTTHLEAMLEDVIKDKVATGIEDHLGDAFSGALEGILGDQLGMSADWLKEALDSHGPQRSLALVSAVLRTSGHTSRPPVEDMRAAFLSVASAIHRAQSGNQSLTDIGSRDSVIHGVWDEMISALSTLTRSLPKALETLKGARGEAAKLVKNLRSDFDVFLAKGPSAFYEISARWRLVWGIYFISLSLLFAGLLYYTLWATGFWHESEQAAERSTREVSPPQTPGMQGRFYGAWAACVYFLHPRKNRDLAFWSCILFMTAMSLLVFVISMFLCIISGFGHFLSSGCAQVYALGDASICLDVLSSLKDTFRTFTGGQHGDTSRESLEEPLPSDICLTMDLTTCSKIDHDMNLSAMFVTVFGLLGVALTFQVVLESAMLHQRMRLKRGKAELPEELDD